MLTHLQLGAELDIATGKEVEAGFDAMAKALGKTPPRPTYLSFTSARFGAGAIVVGAPPQGRIWNIVTFTLVGNDDVTTIVNAKAALYVDSEEGSLSLGNCRIPAQVVPSFQTVSKGTLWAHDNGSVVVNVSGAVAATDQIVATISVMEWRDSDVEDRAPGMP